jgi:Zn finger protein HypA/HybF involved in hydrogenase expression
MEKYGSGNINLPNTDSGIKVAEIISCPKCGTQINNENVTVTKCPNCGVINGN